MNLANIFSIDIEQSQYERRMRDLRQQQARLTDPMWARVADLQQHGAAATWSVMIVAAVLRAADVRGPVSAPGCRGSPETFVLARRNRPCGLRMNRFGADYSTAGSRSGRYGRFEPAVRGCDQLSKPIASASGQQGAARPGSAMTQVAAVTASYSDGPDLGGLLGRSGGLALPVTLLMTGGSTAEQAVVSGEKCFEQLSFPGDDQV